jgi:signal transduction histidine kinase/DNA-binding NarL/FixJ family response regulator
MNAPSDDGLDAWLDEVFPFYVACGADGMVSALGRSLKKILPGETLGRPCNSFVEILRPLGVRSLIALRDRPRSLVTLRAPMGLRLRGQVVARGAGAVFVGTPWFEDLDEVASFGLTVNDFASYDSAADYVVLLSQVRTQLRESNELAQRLSDQIQRAEALRDEARMAKEQAVEASTARDRFLAMMSHELRTPLTTILATNQLMLMGELASAQREHALAQQRAGASLLALINSVLDLSKLQAGKFDLVLESFEPRVALEDVVGAMREEAERKGLVLEWVVAGTVPTSVRGDPVRFRQVITNYVANALKFTERGGVLVRMGMKSADEQRCKLTVTVTDTGIGIEPKAIEGLFEPFVQVHRDRAGYVGTGLGLSICRQIAELMGGAAGGTSVVGKGSSFWFDGWFELDPIPRTRRTGQFRALSVTPPPSLGPVIAPSSAAIVRPSVDRAPRVLIVEDEAVNRRLLALLVEAMGYAVDVASDGHAAVEAVRTAPYAVVLMDCSMPGMDGFEATRVIRAMDGNVSETPVIAVTAHALEGDRERCLTEGMDDYLAKPFNPVQVREALARWAPIEGADPVMRDGVALRVTASGPTGAARSSVDFSVLRALRAYQQPGEEDLVTEVLGLFESDARQRANELELAVERRDVASVRLHAHALKGASSNVGARKVERLAKWIERVDPLDDWAATRDVARAIALEVESSVVLLRAV